MQASGRQSYFSLCTLYLSAERLQPYRHHQDADGLDSLARYCWNMALCEALYPTLQILEVVLRNALHARLSALYGVTWYDRPNLLEPHELAEIASAKSQLQRRRKPLLPGAVIAELTFGFWTSLFDRRYDATLGRRLLQNTPRRAARLLPHAGRQRRIGIVRRRLNSVRRLRNRVFHHEPIWHWSNLLQQHAEVVEVIQWLAPELYHGLAPMDRFQDVYRAGSAAYRPMLDQFCQQHGHVP